MLLQNPPKILHPQNYTNSRKIKQDTSAKQFSRINIKKAKSWRIFQDFLLLVTRTRLELVLPA